MAIITKVDQFTKESFNFYEVSSAEGSANLDGVIYILHTDGKYCRRAFTGAMNVKWFGAKGDGVTDDTAAIQLAINSVKNYKFAVLEFDAGVYIITSQLNIVNGTVNLRGQGAMKKILSGGVRLNNSTIIRWNGTNNKTMLEINTFMGVTIEGICFDTYTTDQDVIQKTGITGIKLVNGSILRYNEIRNCQFSLLDTCINFSDILNDDNMDCNYIDRCEFIDYITGVKIQQTNVYNVLISRCGFYGSPSAANLYTKNHLLILKGHANISDTYLGPLRAAKDGIAIEVNQGFCNLYNVYGETHNGPFFVWKSALYEGMVDENNIPLQIENCTSNLVSCNVVAQTNTLPTNYIVENRTSKTLNVSGGEYSYWFCQKKESGGSIVVTGTDNVNVSSDSEPDRVFFFGNKFGNFPVAGSVYNLADTPGIIDPKNGGKLYVIGEAAELNLTQIKSNVFKNLSMKWVNDSFFIFLDSNNHIEFDFAYRKLKMSGWTIEQ